MSPLAAPEGVLKYLSQLGEDDVAALLAQARQQRAAGATGSASASEPRRAPVDVPNSAPLLCGTCWGCNKGSCCSSHTTAEPADSSTAAAEALEDSEGSDAAAGSAPVAPQAAAREMMRAMEVGAFTRCRDLAAAGADFFHLGEAGWSCLHWAVHAAVASSRAAAAADDEDAPTTTCAEGCCAPVATGPGGRRLLQDLLKLPAVAAAVDVRSADESTPLMFAADAGDAEVCEWLLAAGADASLRDEDGDVAAVWARQRGHAALAQRLLAAAETERR